MYYNTSTKKVYKNSFEVIQEFSNVSFPNRQWFKEDIGEFDLVELQYPKDVVTPPPYEYIEEVDPVEIDGIWTRAFEVRQKDLSELSSEELEQYISNEKAKILAQIAKNRYRKETSNLTVVVEDKYYYFPVTRETQASLNNVYVTLKNGVISETVWKFSDGDWITVNLQSIESIVNAVVAHVQNAFAWEKAESDNVAAITTIDQLKQYVADNPVNYPQS